MEREVFRDILIDVFRGNVSEADKQVEEIIYDNTYNLSDDYDRIKQDRINYEIKKHNRIRNTY